MVFKPIRGSVQVPPARDESDDLPGTTGAGDTDETILKISQPEVTIHLSDWIVLGFNSMSTLVGHSVLSPREREKKDERQ